MSATRTKRTVPFFDYPHVFRSQEKEFLAIIREVGRRGAFVLQPELARFEQNLAAYLGAKHVVGVGSATDGLHLAARAAGIGPGDEVIFCTHTMVATAAAVHFAGAVPVPVECAADHLIDPDSVRGAITPRTKAIMPTQLNGRTADMDALGSIAEEHGLLVIEDAAQALGARYKGRAAGTFGLAGAVSFYPAKMLGCLGDGGCVITDDDTICEKLRALRNHGFGNDGQPVAWALNSRLDNLQAAILDHKLAQYEREVARRRELARLYREHLDDLPQLRLPPGPDGDPDRFDVYQNYEIEAEQRDRLRAFLGERGVGTAVPWGGKAVHQFQRLGFTQRLPYTEELMTRTLLLPMNTSLSDEDVVYVCRCTHEYYGRSV